MSEIVEWKQTQLLEFTDVSQAVDTWATLEAIEQKSHWWKVEILKQVNKNRWMSKFLEGLKEKYDIELSKRYANELRALGIKLDEVGARAPTLVDRIQELPVTTALKVFRADNLENAVEVAENSSQKELETHLRTEKLNDSDFSPQLYNIWNFHFRDPRYGQEGYKWGLIAGQIVENLLYYYTEPGDTVLDPMAGGGTTLDVCKAFNRECIALDLTPIRDDIIQNDILQGLPDDIQDKEIQLVILEPPYFNMKIQDAYPTIQHFYNFSKTAIEHSTISLKIGGYVALIIMDQQHKGNTNFPLIGESYLLLKNAGLTYENLITLPLATSQYEAWAVSKHKEKKELMNINRQMWIFRKCV